MRVLMSCLVLLACGGERNTPPEPEPEVNVPTLQDVAGTWHAVLTSPGGELPFTLELTLSGGAIHNGQERAEIESIHLDGNELTLGFERYAATIVATLEGDTLTGRWLKQARRGHSELAFSAQRGEHPRFPAGAAPDPRLAGSWSVIFSDDDGTFVARGEFALDGARVTGTFVTATGDYRFLEGGADGTKMRLSTFDGAHAFLFDGELDAEGKLTGNFWSRDAYHATWTGERIVGGAPSPLPDPFSEVRITSEDQKLRFSFPTLEGETVAMPSDRFEDKVVVIDIFGTWCPNCADLAPLLHRWEREHEQLEVVAIAFEVTEELGRQQLQRWKERYEVEHPLLLGGLASKQRVAEAFPDLSTFRSYPTLIFVGRDGRVRHIYSGFYGPATGDLHTDMVADLDARLEALLSE